MKSEFRQNRQCPSLPSVDLRARGAGSVEPHISAESATEIAAAASFRQNRQPNPESRQNRQPKLRQLRESGRIGNHLTLAVRLSLQAEQLGIATSQRQQFRMASLLQDAAVLEHEDAICQAHRTETV